MEEAPAATLTRLLAGAQVSQAIHVAATLGVADLLSGGPRSSEDLAAETGAHAGSLYRLLRALASVGVLRTFSGLFVIEASPTELASAD
jgi:DNA-binding IclR family transcriptional regulator